MEDPRALRALVDGAAQLVLVLGNSPEQERLERGVLEAARRADVAHVVKVSAPVVHGDVPVAIARMHRRVERHAAELGLELTALRSYALLQNLLTLVPQIRATGTFSGTAGDAPRCWVARTRRG